MKYKYGEFTDEQIILTKTSIRKNIFFLLLCADPQLAEQYKEVNVNDAFQGLLFKLGGLNKILYEPPELVVIISLLEEAWAIYNQPLFNFKDYRKCILDAGALVQAINEKVR